MNLKSKEERHAFYKIQAEKGQFFTIEEPLSKRSKCKICHKNILDKVRVRHVVCNATCATEKKTGIKDSCGNYHLECFKDEQSKNKDRFLHSNSDWKPVVNTSQFHGYEELKEEIKVIVMEYFTTDEQVEKRAKKQKIEN